MKRELQQKITTLQLVKENTVSAHIILIKMPNMRISKPNVPRNKQQHHGCY